MHSCIAAVAKRSENAAPQPLWHPIAAFVNQVSLPVRHADACNSYNKTLEKGVWLNKAAFKSHTPKCVLSSLSAVMHAEEVLLQEVCAVEPKACDNMWHHFQQKSHL